MNIPDYLKPTPEWIKEESRRQAKIRSTHAKRTAGQQWIDYYRTQAQLLTANLARLVEENTDHIAIVEQQNELAECYAYLGEFDRAAFWATDEPVKARVERLRHAVERDDKEICSCPNTVHTDSKGTTTLPPRLDKTGEYILSPKHGRIMHVQVCTKCGDAQVGGTEGGRPDDSKHRDGRMATKLAQAKRKR